MGERVPGHSRFFCGGVTGGCGVGGGAGGGGVGGPKSSQYSCTCAACARSVSLMGGFAGAGGGVGGPQRMRGSSSSDSLSLTFAPELYEAA